jgi:epoxyqueuosine reductase
MIAVLREALAAELRRLGQDAGLDAVGIAAATPFTDTLRHLEERKAAGLDGGMQFTYRNPARSTDPGRIVADAASLVVGARRYLRAAAASGPPHDSTTIARPPDDSARTTPTPRPWGRVARYSWTDHYAALREGLEVMAGRLRREGYVALVVADDNRLVDREAAYRAGLGWYGKNTNLLLPGLGSWYVLGAVVTDARLPVAHEPASDGCGSCTRCLPACPTGAFVGPGVLDARRCLAWLVQAPGIFPREYREALGDRIYGCDDCQEVCPVNIAAERRHPASPAGASDQRTVDLLGLLEASDDDIMATVGRWYIPNRDPRYVRRNALLALANVGDPADPAVAGAVARQLASPDALMRAHAVWVAARLGRRDLLRDAHSTGSAEPRSGPGAPGLFADPDPDVRAELAAAASVTTRSRPAMAVRSPTVRG